MLDDLPRQARQAGVRTSTISTVPLYSLDRDHHAFLAVLADGTRGVASIGADLTRDLARLFDRDPAVYELAYGAPATPGTTDVEVRVRQPGTDAAILPLQSVTSVGTGGRPAEGRRDTGADFFISSNMAATVWARPVQSSRGRHVDVTMKVTAKDAEHSTWRLTLVSQSMEGRLVGATSTECARPALLTANTATFTGRVPGERGRTHVRVVLESCAIDHAGGQRVAGGVVYVDE